MSKIKRLIALFLVVLMCPFTFFCAHAENQDNQYTIQTVDMLISDSGMSRQDWVAQALQEKQAGLDNPVTPEKLKELAPNAQLFQKDGKIYMMRDLEGMASIQKPLDAYRTMYSLLKLLHGADEATLHLWSKLNMANHQVYTFQQVYEGLTVPASTAKIVTDSDGHVTAVFSSLSSVLPESTGTEIISAADAENIVRKHLEEHLAPDSVMPDHTTRTVISQDESEESDVLPDILAWVVYSRNPRFSDNSFVDLPYLAHFVSMDGTYLRNCPVAIPEDPALDAGYSSAYAFEFMEADEWTGEVLEQDGNLRSLTVPVMKDTRTGVWYLADPVRKIAVGDFSALAYNDGAINLVAQTNNISWDDEDLITYANMIQVWDFYAAYGWKGPDGKATPVLLLRNMCTETGESIYNAAYLGQCRGWQCFAYGGNAYIGQSLDVIAHEFTHCLTDTVMNTNLYRNDMGAINEAMSDIMGNLCEMIGKVTNDTEWQIGESTGTTFRSMLDPHKYDQPEYVWDIFYVPNASRPNDMNDRGGVHNNSSLLNYVAAHLCKDHGMSLKDAANFWLHTAFVLTPTTNYEQLSNVLPWALQISGNGSHLQELGALIQRTRMAETKVPDELPENYRLVSLKLPDTEAFKDGKWIMYAVQLDTEYLAERLNAVRDFAGHVLRLDLDSTEFFQELDKVLSLLHLDPESLLEYLSSETGVYEWLSSITSEAVKLHTSWESAENSGISLVLKDCPTFYVLFGTSGEEDELWSMAFLVGDEWFDPIVLVPDFSELDVQNYSNELGRLFKSIQNLIAGYFNPDPSASQNVILSSKGLENVSLHEVEEPEYLPEDELNSVGIQTLLPTNDQ
ncbi:MAG: M4 family metallopeptidase [Clostridiales bacterium]|nr:M4 family metallopeptidase [Clostridiales bacterium]